MDSEVASPWDNYKLFPTTPVRGFLIFGHL
ncbi:hypothetical protein J2Y03_000400 [Neobacillus niacini]|nr:hypothetical protein [Neobacillus niacini]